MRDKYNTREVRGFSIFEHGIFLKYYIQLNSNNAYYDSFAGSVIEGKKVEFETDKDGYIVPSRLYDEADMTYVFMGDSSVECTFVDKDKRYPFWVGRKIERKLNRKVNSFNAGVSGADILSMMKVLLNKVFVEHPDVVFVCNTKSELFFLLSNSEDIYWGANNNKERVVYSDLVYYKSLGARIIEAMDIVLDGRIKPKFKHQNKTSDRRCFSAEIKRDKANILNMYKNDLVAFVQLCVCRNISPILMTQANRYKEKGCIKEYYINNDLKKTGLPYEEYVALYDECNEIVRAVATDCNVKLIDLERLLKNEKDLLYDAVHYTDKGSEYVAELIADLYIKLYYETDERYI